MAAADTNNPYYLTCLPSLKAELFCEDTQWNILGESRQLAVGTGFLSSVLPVLHLGPWNMLAVPHHPQLSRVKALHPHTHTAHRQLSSCFAFHQQWVSRDQLRRRVLTVTAKPCQCCKKRKKKEKKQSKANGTNTGNKRALYCVWRDIPTLFSVPRDSRRNTSTK